MVENDSKLFIGMKRYKRSRLLSNGKYFRNLDFWSTNPSLSKHRSPEEELQCAEKLAMTTPGVSRNPERSSRALGQSASGDASDSSLHHHRRKSSALPRRLWSADRDSTSSPRAKGAVFCTV